jgi:hypothetical protein
MTQPWFQRFPGAPRVISQDRLKDLLAYGVALIIGLAAAVIPYFFNRRFYFNDDQQNEVYPYYIEIGRQLHRHHLSFLTLSTFNGGNLCIDWQYTVFNPVSLFCSWFLCTAQDLDVAGLYLCGFYIVLTALAAYSLGRSFQLPRALSLVAAAVLSTNNYVLYFYAHAWVPGLMAQCWFLWTWSSLQRFRATGQRRPLFFFVLFAYLMVTSGWPHADLLLACLIIGYALDLHLSEAKPARLWALILAAVSAVLLTLPALLPAFFSYAWTNRINGFYSNGAFMPSLGDVLNLSSFFHPHHMQVWSIRYTFVVPIFYLAWFVWGFIPLLRWAAIESALSRRVVLLAFGAFAFAMLFSSEQLGPLRWPIRFIPFFHYAFIYAFLIALNHSESIVITSKRLCVSVTALFLCNLFSIFSEPSLAKTQMLGFALSLVLSFSAFILVYLRCPRFFSFILILGIFVGFAITHFLSPINVIVRDLFANASVSPDKMTAIRTFDGYSLYLGGRPRNADWNRNCFFAADGIYESRFTIGGETSIGQRAFAQRFMPGDFEGLWTEIRTQPGLTALFSNEPETGACFLDLMRVNTLCASDVYLNVKGSTIWKETRKTSFTTWYERIHPNLQPTTLSWSSPGIAATSEQPPIGEKEILRVKSGHQGGFLVFARMYWPGYHAELDGRPLKVGPLAGFLLKVDMPENCEGRLILTFVPPGLQIGCAGAALGFILLIVSLAVIHLQRKSGDPASLSDFTVPRNP